MLKRWEGSCGEKGVSRESTGEYEGIREHEGISAYIARPEL
jgi:hypothetical protein